MDIEDLRRRLRASGTAVFWTGSVLFLSGVAGMIRFYAAFSPRMSTATAEQLVRAAALPHAATVLGVGGIVFGLVLVHRSRSLS
ncbi:MAG: hypothetical protein FJ224_11915 [Lentisphaerae bacterium]|nr:hypothetical protein [Lentisphaerota bacterium]